MPPDNQYMDSTNSDVFQTLAQQNAQAMQGRGGGGGGGVADIILGQNNDFQNVEASKDRDVKRMLEVQQIQDSRSQHQKNLDLDRDKEMMEYQTNKANESMLRLQLNEVKKSQMEEDAAGPINEETNRLTKEMNDLQRQTLAAAAAYEKSKNQETIGITTNTGLLKEHAAAKDIFLGSLDTNLKLKGNLSSYEIGNGRENVEISNHVLSTIANKMGTDFIEKRSGINKIGYGLAEGVEGVTEFFGGRDNVSNVDIASRYMSNPELEGIYANALAFQNGSLKKIMEQSGEDLSPFEKSTVNNQQKFTSEFLADSYISLLRNSNFSVTTDQAKKEVTDFFTTLQQKSTGPVETREQLERNKSELAPQISQLSQSLFGGPGHEPEVVETLLAAMKGFKSDAVNLSGAVRTPGSDVIDHKSLMIAGFSNALSVGGKLESWFKGHTLGSYMTREGVNLALGNLAVSGSDYNKVLLDPATIKGLKSTPEGQQIIDLMTKGVQNETTRKTAIAQAAEKQTKLTEDLKGVEQKGPGARTNFRTGQRADIESQLKLIAKKLGK